MVNSRINPDNVNPSYVVLNNLTALSIEGPDAITFLQGQTTCDMRQLTVSNSITGAVCNTKGRVIFSFRAILDNHQENLLWLLLPADQLSLAQTTLQKYIVFSKAKLATKPSPKVVGIIAENIGSVSSDLMHSTKDATQGVSNQHNGDGGMAVIVSDNRAIVLLNDMEFTFPEDFHETSKNRWKLHDIRDGVATIENAVAEEFIPQLLNYDLTDSISFKKGCYIGQEIVARMQYKGNVKKRMYRVKGALLSGAIPAPGDNIFTSSSSATETPTADTFKKIGQIVTAAKSVSALEVEETMSDSNTTDSIENGCFEALAVLPIEEANEDNLYLIRDENDSDRAKIKVLSLPYAITK